MIGDWVAATPAVLAATSVVFIPGLAAMYLIGLRGLALVGFAPLFSVASIGVAALLLGQVGLEWSTITWALAMAAFVGVAWLVGRVLGPPKRALKCSERRLLGIGIGIGIVFSAWRLITYIGDPGGISQTNDAVFHMNAVRFVLETADASSLHVNAVIGGHSFYPAAWHGVTSLVVLLTGAGIPVAANAVSVVIGALIWPLGLAWLARSTFRSNAVAAYAAVLASALQAFPLLMFQWGVLFPNALSTAMVPAGIAGVIVAGLGIRRVSRWRDAARLALFVIVTALALALSQPSALLPWAAITLIWGSYQILTRAAGTRWIAAISTVIVAWIVLGVVWIYLARGTSGSHWAPFRGELEAGLDVLLNTHVRMVAAPVVGVLTMIGLVAALLRPSWRWFAIAWAGVSLLYVAVASVDNADIRESVLGAWYADPYRIAALAPLAAIPLAALGIHTLVRLAMRRQPMSGRRGGRALFGLGLVTVLMLVILATRSVAMPAFLEGTYDRDSRYYAAEDAYLDPDERTLLEDLPEHVGPGERVIGNPSTGAGFGYFLSGVDVYPRTWSPPRTEEWEIIAEGLRDAASDPAVCGALGVYGEPEFVIDFGPSEGGAGKFPAPGMTGFEGQPGFTLVERHGDASLWRITACSW